MSERMPAAVLVIEDFVPIQTKADLNLFWRSLLDQVIAGGGTGVGFSGVSSTDDLEKFRCFADWQPAPLGSVAVEIERDLPEAGRSAARDTYLVFELREVVLERLARTHFDAWSASNDAYPTDRLAFFNDDDLLAEVETYEGMLLFCGTEEQLSAMLCHLRPDPRPYLNRSRNWVVRSWWATN